MTRLSAGPLPVLVFLDLMGLPRNMCDTFVEWAIALLHSNDRAIMGETMAKITAYLQGAIAEKESEPLTDGLISQIVHASIDGRPISAQGKVRLRRVPVHRRARHGVCHAKQHLAVAGPQS